MKNLILTLSLGAFVIPPALAGDWNEPTNGDLSGNNLAPTPLVFTVGSNKVKGTMGGDPGAGIPLDRDIFTITLAPNQTITSINVRAYAPAGASFYAIGPGASISITSAATHLSNMLITGTGEILPTLAAGAYQGGTGLSNPIGPGGTYTLWFQEVSSVVNYEFDYTVSEPTSSASVAVPALPFGPVGSGAAAGAFVMLGIRALRRLQRVNKRSHG